MLVRIASLIGHRLPINLFLIFITASGIADEIYVGGTMEQDEVWTKNNTYIVFQDLRIPQNITLTIEPGVEVKINQGRGILVLKGSLVVDGEQNEIVDSINFSANYTSRFLDWKWKGIIFIGVSETNSNILSYANITDAEVGIDIYISDHISIKNTSILNSQQLGIRISNSSSIVVQNCDIKNSYDGIEMIVNNDQTTSDNLIDHCILKNNNHNIYIYKEFRGVLMGNSITSNLIEGANNGIWMDNGGGISAGQNTIERNLLIDNGNGAGYGMLISLDSVIVKNNIFWKNYIAVFYEQKTKACDILNNSFYQNYKGIVLSDQSVGNIFLHNTFSVNEHTCYEMGESAGTIFHLNNIFADAGQENIVINSTENDVNIDQNFWNTLNDTAIQTLIWDKLDIPLLGLMLYNPFLTEADTTNPISPPLLIKKQLVDDQVRISWSTNPEKDFNYYKVYFGNFENYSFSDQTEVGTDTTVMLSGISVYDSIAVTSSDDANTVNNRQVLGHESPFAFASLYPYAGPDAVICKSVTEYKINKSTIPFTYQGLNWTTEGDGTFNNEHFVHPTYYPGPADVLEGTVVITLYTFFEGKTLSDSFILSIIGDPFVYAGNDTIVYFDANIDLSNADALNYDHLKWISTGDGSFDNDTILNPIYTPGDKDISNEQVDLVLMADSECGSASDTITVFLKSHYSVEGHLWYFDQKVNPGIILAILDGATGIKTMQSANTNTEAYFNFDKLAAGSYYLYAVPDTVNISKAVPGYYANKLKWQEAYKLEVNADVYDIDIYLPSTDYQLPEGEASISGHFIMPASGLFSSDIFCCSWFTKKDEYGYCRGGVSNITVFLYNSDATKLLDFTLTDRDGNFYFNHLPYGNYIVDAEKTGYQTTVSPVIGLSPEHKHETGIVLEVNEKKIGIYRTNITPPLTNSNQVYPNPTKGELNLITAVATGQQSGSIKIFNIFGQNVLSENITFDSPDKHFRVKLNVAHLPSGIYFGTVNNGKFTFIKH